MTTDPAGPPSPHLDFCSGGEFCTLDDCLCECHVAPAPAGLDALLETLLLAVEEVDNAWSDDGTEWTYNDEVFEPRLTDLRRAYGAYLDAERAATRPAEDAGERP